MKYGAIATLSIVLSIILPCPDGWAKERDILFDFPSSTAEKTVKYIARRSGKSVLFQINEIETVKTLKLSGRYTVKLALDAVFKGTSLVGDLTNKGVIIITRAQNFEENQRENSMKKTLFKKRLKAGVSIAASLLPAIAQAEETSNSIIEEIIVTANKRSQSIQDVPVSIVAFNANDLRTRGLTSTLDLENKTLGLNLTMLQSNPTIAIRGVGNTISGIQSDPTVGLYNEGIYQARPALFRVGFYDLNRVEVLKGPQGTLYGRNTTGGVINVVSNDPTDEFGGYASLGTGSFKMLTTEGAVNVPFDKGAVRVAGYIVRDDGYTENLASDQRLDARDTRAFRIKVKFEPSENLTTLFAFEAVNDDSTPGSGYLNSRVDDPVTGISLTEESEQMYMAFGNGTDARHVNLDGDVYSNRDIYQLTAKVTYETDSITFKSISGYVDMSLVDAIDTDGTNAPIEQSINKEKSQSYSQEFQLSGNDTDEVDWIGGLYYFKEKASSDNYFGFSTVPFGGSDLYEDKSLNKANTSSYGIFLNVGYHVSDVVKFTVGARYTHEKKDFAKKDLASGEEGPITEVSYNEITPKAILEWTPNEDTLVYASVTNGFKSGGLSFGRLGVPATPYDPERLWAYEVGAKNTLLDGKVQLNLAGFYYDFKNLQTDTLVQDLITGLLTTVIGNSPNVKIKGIEVDMKAQITEGFRLDASFAYTDSKFPGTVHALPHTPKWRTNLGAEYLTHLETGNLIFRMDMTYQSRMLFQGLNTPELEQSAGYSLFDAGIVYENDKNDWTVSLAVKNITNKEVLAIRGDFRPFNILELYAPPRTWELRFTTNF